MNHPHLGECIEARRVQVGMTKAELGRRLNISRQAIDPLLKRKALYTDTLVKVGEILEFDFATLLISSPIEEEEKPPQMYISVPLPADQDKLAQLLRIIDHAS